MMHLDENDIARYVDECLADAERQRMDDHLAECPRCRDVLETTRRTLEGASEREAVEPESTVRHRVQDLVPEKATRSPAMERLGGLPPLHVAALALLLIGVGGGIWVWQTGVTNPAQFRTNSSEPLLSAQAPADGAVLSERPTFVLGAEPRALSYRIMLYASEGRLVWRKDTTATRVPLPADVDLTDDQQYLWQAQAVLQYGTTLRSAPHAFTYAP